MKFGFFMKFCGEKKQISGKKCIFFVLVSFCLLGSCKGSKKDVLGPSNINSASNKVNCDVDYASLNTSNLSGITINDRGISQQEKIRHLNELNRMPAAFLNVIRSKNIPVNLTAGAITEFPELASMKGQTPRGWPSGYTWDTVPGTGDQTGIYLGNSALTNNAWSLAVHEGTHAVDLSVSFSTTNKALIEAFNKIKNSPNSSDTNASYRTGYIEEALAIGIDEYYCNATTKANLKSWYPDFYAFIENSFANELNAQLAGTAQTVAASANGFSSASSGGYPACSSSAQDIGSGYGWENNSYCLKNGTGTASASSGSYPACSSSAQDIGSGYGWENNSYCLKNGTGVSSAWAGSPYYGGYPACSSSAQDIGSGYGWENNSYCLKNGTGGVSSAWAGSPYYGSYPACSPSAQDIGSGYGWENNYYCRK
ncbi:MAG: hypothetical protein HQK54_00545 [Oligoflexales bacterium]|nr:hypothetical protein [Oligoflexales bacterium]